MRNVKLHDIASFPKYERKPWQGSERLPIHATA